MPQNCQILAQNETSFFRPKMLNSGGDQEE